MSISARTSGRPGLRRTIIVSLLICIGSAVCSADPPEQPRAEAGLLDLRLWDFFQDKELELSGEWIFHPGALLDDAAIAAAGPGTTRVVPDFWKGGDAAGKNGQGAGTYRLRLLLPRTRPELAIRYSTVSTSFEMDIDGIQRANAGRPAVDPDQAEAGCRPGTVVLDASRDEAIVTVRVSNHEYRNGGMWRAFRLGEKQGIEAARKKETVVSIFLFAFFIAIALNSLMVYFFRRKERSQLSFAVLTLILALRPLVTGDYPIVEAFPQLPFSWLIRLVYLTSFLPIPVAAIFISNLFPDMAPRRLMLWLGLPTLPFVAMAIAAPLPFLTRVIFVFYIVAFISLALLFFGVLVRAVLRKRPDAPAMTASAAVMIAAGINDILYASFAIHTGYFLPYGLAVMVMVQAAVLSRRFTKAFDTAEELTVVISRTNNDLEAEIERRKSVQAQLEALLVEKDSLLRNVHHWVRNSLQIVSSVLSLESNRTKDALQVERYANIKARVRAIGLVHERLYESRSTDELELRIVVQELLDLLIAGYGEEYECDVKVSMPSLFVSPRVCIDFGLILTELVSNSFKFAVLPRGKGQIAIDVERDGDELVLRVEDDGPGFPPDFDPAQARSIGYRMLMRMVQAYEGVCRILPEKSTLVEVRLPLR